jgi:nucleoside 2-deoxyribosyltransferase
MKIVKCNRCGKYEISETTISFFTSFNVRQAALISHWIRINQSDSVINLDEDKIKSILNNARLPKPKEQADNLLNWIGESLEKPDGETNIPLRLLISTIGCIDGEGVKYVVDYLKKQDYINHMGFTISFSEGERNPPEDLLIAKMTFKGWDRYYELQQINKDSRLAFMAMKYGDEQLNRIFNEIIKDAVSKTGFDIRKLDEEKSAGSIDDKLRVEIRKSKFVIADLTHDNNGAYWEAGYAEGLSMPVIYICEEEKFKTSKSHFDTNHHLTVPWKDDEAGLTKFADELKATIRATLPTEAQQED